MAMTGGTSYLLKSEYPEGNSWTIDLYLYVKVGQPNITANTTPLTLGMYVYTPYGIGDWGDFNGSYIGLGGYNGRAEQKTSFNGAIPHFSGTRWLVENCTVTVNHASDGSCSAAPIIWHWGVNSPWGRYQNPSGTKTISIASIPRTSGASNFSINLSNGSLYVYIDSKSSSFTHNVGLYYNGGNKNGESIAYWDSIGGGAFNPTLSSDILNGIFNNSPTDNSRSFRLNVDTMSGGTRIGTSVVYTNGEIPSTLVPRITSFNSSMASSKINGIYVKGNSTTQWSVGVANATGAYVKQCVISGPNLYSVQTHNAESYNATSSSLTSSGTLTYTATVTDSRGRSTTASGTIYVEDYNTPSINYYSSFRSNSDGSTNNSGTYVTHKFVPYFSSLNGKNSATITIYSKESSNPTYGNKVTIGSNNNTYTHSSFDIALAYDFKIVISDTVGQSFTAYTRVGSKNIPINIANNNMSVSVGGFAQSSNSGRFDCNWEAHFVSSPIVDSDRKLKRDIQDIDIDIIDDLRPVQYKLINESSDITHYGFIAQDVESVLLNSVSSDKKLGIVRYDKNDETNEKINYALSYEEIIPLLVKKCQELQQEINELKWK